jgi:hypothetical protein
MRNMAAQNGGVGIMRHERELTPLDKQTIIRMNLDTFHSSAVVDLAAGPVTVTMPDVTDGRYAALEVVSQDIPVDGFWSINVYNKDEFFALNDLNRNALNNVTGVKDADGAIMVQFGGCSASGPDNCIPITDGWNDIVRLYRPRAEVLNGSWTLDVAAPKS